MQPALKPLLVQSPARTDRTGFFANANSIQDFCTPLTLYSATSFGTRHRGFRAALLVVYAAVERRITLRCFHLARPRARRTVKKFSCLRGGGLGADGLAHLGGQTSESRRRITPDPSDGGEPQPGSTCALAGLQHIARASLREVGASLRLDLPSFYSTAMDAQSFPPPMSLLYRGPLNRFRKDHALR